jgi:hypothetical protein
MYVAGYAPHSFLLSRHLPPLGEGVAAAYGDALSAAGAVVIDPFGHSPRIALELARSGRRAIVTTNNPTLRMALGAAFNPVSSQIFLLALTRLADARLVNDRVETYVRRLYSSTCADCESPVEVDTFQWEKDTLVEKSYHCQVCDTEKTRPVNAADLELAARQAARGPHFHWALDRAVPASDQATTEAATVATLTEALDAYTPRALNAIFTLTNKAGTLILEPVQRRALELLMIAAYDEAISLEGIRPRTLKPHVRYRERNIWLALERFARDDSWQADDGPRPELLSVTDLLTHEQAGLAIHDGSLRNLAEANLLPPQSVALIMSALPRPNLVFWALSALWASWLWGESAAGPLRRLIRRRRYDWAWHETALRSNFQTARSLAAKASHLVALLPEAEPGFVAAALIAADGAGFTVANASLRAEPPEAQFVFQPDSLSSTHPVELKDAVRARVEAAAAEVLHDRGEASRWHSVSGAAFTALAREHLLRALVEQTEEEPYNALVEYVETACLRSKQLVVIENEASEAEMIRASKVWWWLAKASVPKPPLADRTESQVAHLLEAEPDGLDFVAVEQRTCNALAALTLPGSTLIRHCLESYGEERDGLWFCRGEDRPDVRALDSAHIYDDLVLVGQRLGYGVELATSDMLVWNMNDGRAAYRFCITDTAAIARFVLAPPPEDAARRVLVIPGSRAGLIQYKLERDARLRQVTARHNWLFVKYRHVRWLASQPDINPAELDLALLRDPITEITQRQLPLL